MVVLGVGESEGGFESEDARVADVGAVEEGEEEEEEEDGQDSRVGFSEDAAGEELGFGVVVVVVVVVGGGRERGGGADAEVVAGGFEG